MLNKKVVADVRRVRACRTHTTTREAKKREDKKSV
jgi:hypothetical protein